MSQWSREDTDSLSEGYTNRSAPYLPRRPDVIPARTYQTVRSATIYSRKCRHDRTKPKFGEIKNDRHYCTYVDTRTKLTCAIWPDGYTTWYDLVRHADAEHGPGKLFPRHAGVCVCVWVGFLLIIRRISPPEEVALIEQGLLDYTKAQWIKTEDQFHAIKAVSREMHCTECGMQFASNRQDSKERHRKRGAWCVRFSSSPSPPSLFFRRFLRKIYAMLKVPCYRSQRRQAKKQKSDFDSMVHYPKRKGGKTSPTNKRR